MTNSIQFIEPSLSTKRQGIIDKRFGKPTRGEEVIKEKLQAMRKREVSNTSKNLRAFIKYAKKIPGLTLHTVKTPAAAVDVINQESQTSGISNIAVNRSSTIRALEPHLEKNGFTIINTYDHLIGSGTLGVYTDNIKTQYWGLAGFELQQAYQSFGLNTRPVVYPKDVLLGPNVDPNSQFIGLIGANVFAATGEIFSVQHMYNISSILNHARSVFIILTVDKLVGDLDDARFQARCTAMYGLEQIILDLFENTGDDGKVKKTTTKNDLDLRRYKPPENVHVILLDDNRRELLGTKDEELLCCIGCRRCGLICPRIRAGTDAPKQKLKLTARELIMDGLLQGTEKVVEDGLFDCTLCRACTTKCPVGIELADRLLDLREKCQKSDSFSKPHKRIRNNILEFGNAYGEEYTQQATPWGRTR